MLFSDIILSVRNSIRNTRYTVINVIGLSIGITACLVIYTFIRYEMNYNTFHINADRIYRIVEQSRSEGSVEYYSTTAYPLAQAVRNDFPGVKVTQTAGPFTQVISNNSWQKINRFEENQVLYADVNYFKIFDFAKVFHGNNRLWLQGDPQTAFSNPNAVILTQSIAKKYFPDAMLSNESVIGKTLLINNKELLTVTGLIKDPPHNTSVSFTMLVNYELYKKTNTYEANNWSGNYSGFTYVVLPQGAQPKEFESKLNSFKKTYLTPTDDKKISYDLVPLKKIHQETQYRYSDYYVVSQSMIAALSGLGLFILLIACVNFINLATAHGLKRTGEVSIRKILGSSRFHLFRRFFIETLVITVFAVGVSITASTYILGFLNQALAIIGMDMHIGIQTTVFAGLITIVVAILAGTYPALLITAKKPLETIKGLREFKGGLTLRRGLIVFQFFIAQAFIIGTIVMSKQMNLFNSKDLGFAKKAIVMVNIPDTNRNKMELLKQRLENTNSISGVSFASGAPIATSGHYGTDFRLSQEPVNRMRDGEMKVVDSNYLKLYHLQLIAGHNIEQANFTEGGYNGLLVNETLVKSIGLTPTAALGKTLITNEGRAAIIGVIKDFNNNPLQGGITPCVLYYQKNYFSSAGIQLNASNSNVQDVLQYIHKIWQQIYPDALYKFDFLDKSIADQYIVEDMSYKAFQVLAFAAILIGCLGLYGLVSFMAETRIKEIGVRKVLGASVLNIISLFLSEFFKLLGIAFVIAAPVAFYLMTQWLNNFKYRTDIGVSTFVLAVEITFVIALLSVGYKCFVAATAKPMKNLRTE